MPAQGGVDMSDTSRQKVYVPGSRPDLRVPFAEVGLGDSPKGERNPPVRLYDTSGPGADPLVGLAGVRRPWILGRSDVEPYEGRGPNLRDDGRASARGHRTPESFPGGIAQPLRARASRVVTQM
ncbi:MAG: phosphomethylpyrimidine synthase ThiC, partial [Solirubrobacterales bacterium]|nr:phosphomethylpyrimidine synthase ThiC [Solirubrobacterales bacterium]